MVARAHIIGALLFILDTTTLSTLISSLSNHHLYADNTQLFFSASVFDSSITQL